MASINVIKKSIEMLERANNILLEKRNKTENSKEKEAYNKEITKNQSMILDFKFRLTEKYDE